MNTIAKVFIAIGLVFFIAVVYYLTFVTERSEYRSIDAKAAALDGGSRTSGGCMPDLMPMVLLAAVLALSLFLYNKYRLSKDKAKDTN